MRLQEFGGRGRLVVELGDVTVPLRIVVVRVDDNLARQRRHRHVAVVLQRHGDDDEVTGLGGLDGRRRARTRPELGHECSQRLRTAGIAEHHVVTVRERKPRDLTSDVTGANESNRFHDVSPLGMLLRGR